ncbi:hypothetical protein DTO164E3_8612 [Paecilomyces variotii]|nr:hypothetical protein DTO164E3_8612 [Paecilomyces variotii]KAJ9406501.1 hypothetical protein DTO045G8_5672 [Paecilomyces variotii]
MNQEASKKRRKSYHSANSSISSHFFSLLHPLFAEPQRPGVNSVFRDIHGPCTPYFDQRALAGCGARILARRCTSLTLQYSPSLQTLVWYPRRASASALFHSTYTTRGNWPFFPIILCASPEFTLTHRSAFHLDGLRSRRYSLELIRAVAQPTSDRDPSPGAGPATAPLHLIWWHLAVTSEAEGQHLKVTTFPDTLYTEAWRVKRRCGILPKTLASRFPPANSTSSTPQEPPLNWAEALQEAHTLRAIMASPATSTFRPPISPPAPVYLRSSPPPPTESDIPPPPPFRKGLSDSPEAKPNAQKISRKPLRPTPLEIGHDAVIHNSPVSPVKIDDGSELPQASSALIEHSNDGYSEHTPPVETFSRMSVNDWPHSQQQGAGAGLPNSVPPPRADSIPPIQLSQPQDHRHTPASGSSWSLVGPPGKDETQSHDKANAMPEEHSSNKSTNDASDVSRGSVDSMPEPAEIYQPLQYHHQPFRDITNGPNGAGPNGNLATARKSSAGLSIPRPSSAYSSVSDLANRGRNLSPHPSPNSQARGSSRHSTASPDNRPLSYIDLMNVPYPQPPPAPTAMSKSYLRAFVGNNASLLGHKQTFEMYLANVKKANDPSIQYEFAVFMVNAVREMPPEELEDGESSTHSGAESSEITRARLLREARSILQLLASRGHPFSQYYLADGYASGLFSNGKEDYDRAFPLFVAASKHGHAEAGYRVGLCYEFGWGSKLDGAKAAQFYRQAASKNHPGAMLRLAKACLAGQMGLGKRYREGVTWLKRAAESVDELYNAGPYELGLLHETGYGDDVFPDPSYAAQLFTKSAELGHPEANYRLGDAYEHGKLNCPRDPALSVHFYTGAAQAGHPLAMMALCAWYLVGAQPVLDKDESEAYEWAKRAAETGLAKAQYAVGYFTEMGIGCRRDPLEANVWYVKAADQGDERAKHRIAAIMAAAEGANPATPVATTNSGSKQKSKSDTSPGGDKAKPKRFGIF